MGTITETMINAAFDEGLEVRNGKKTYAEADRRLVAEFGFSASTAKDFTRNLQCLLDGRRYQRGLNIQAVTIFLSRIHDELGVKALAYAVDSVEKHITYAEQVGRSRAITLREILSSFQTTIRTTAPAKDATSHQQEFQKNVVKSADDDPETRRLRLAKAPAQPKTVMTVFKSYDRNPDVVAERLYLAQGHCDFCKHAAPFSRRHNEAPYLEVHHLIPLAEGGADTVENTKALCPNCHREAHFGQEWEKFRQ